MGTLGTLLDLASLSLQISTAGKLAAMKQQGAAAALMQAMLVEMRNQVFKYNETARKLLAMESTSLLLATGAMRVLETRIKDSGLSADLFDEIADKEYFANTVRTVHDNGARMTAQLPAADRQTLEIMLAKTARWSDYDFYVDSYPQIQQYRQALPGSAGPGAGRRNLGLFTLLGCGGLAALGLCEGLVAAGISQTNGNNAAGTFIMGSLVMGAIAFWGYRTYVQANKTIADKKIVDKVSSEVDLRRFEALEREFGSDLGKVNQLMGEAQTAFQQFFGDAKFLSA